MLYELAKARRRGVDVRVILPLVGNHGPVNKSNALAANAMLKSRYAPATIVVHTSFHKPPVIFADSELIEWLLWPRADDDPDSRRTL